ncbi:Ribosome-recycling factor [Smittium mucronatum]|uniref:Ribosome-recycling factor n=1 Tax=Smittium mucronatum TaxID=133383 RepID=A0A1R0GX00_9FUNG|nr:Ribosome-recycling factor [Smittium mucronatum]
MSIAKSNAFLKLSRMVNPFSATFSNSKVYITSKPYFANVGSNSRSFRIMPQSQILLRFYSKKAKENKAQVKQLAKDIKKDDDGNLELVDLEKYEEKMSKVIAYLSNELLSVRSGRANPNLISSIHFVSGNKKQTLEQVASISVKDAQTLIVVPFDDSTSTEIEKAIRNSGLGLNPQVSGNSIRVPIPRQTKESRDKVAKSLTQLSESTKVQLRKLRQDANKKLKSKEKAVSKDYFKQWEADVDELSTKYIEKIDTAVKQKLKEIEN